LQTLASNQTAALISHSQTRWHCGTPARQRQCVTDKDNYRTTMRHWSTNKVVVVDLSGCMVNFSEQTGLLQQAAACPFLPDEDFL